MELLLSGSARFFAVRIRDLLSERCFGFSQAFPAAPRQRNLGKFLLITVVRPSRRVHDENRSPVSLWEIRLAAYFIRLTALAYFCDFICWFGLIVGFPDISGSSVDWELFLVVLEIIFGGYILGLLLGWNNCRFLWRIFQFWVVPK
ncbi:proline-rich receptor-like protein kinase PERK9 [Iris pallida]|uniref:Proline-rich receptor-like protein kinase PERK9 n=1 Tax=Iris pallida TaxID=29817 RepID=A0AAX6IJV5_IRIPA|nr:proline-rich receptor-like protein kinase PERK9 [Iris pallida]